MDENYGKVLRDTDGEIVGFWMKPPESGLISCSNIEGLTINSDQINIVDDRWHIYVNGKELPECESFAWFEAAINEKAAREKPENQKHIDVLISFMNGLTKQINGGKFVEFKAVEVVQAISFLCGEREIDNGLPI